MDFHSRRVSVVLMFLLVLAVHCDDHRIEDANKGMLGQIKDKLLNADAASEVFDWVFGSAE